jgi:hypothetical protein
MRSRLSGARWVVLLLVLTTVFFWKLGFSDRFTFLNSPDLVGQVIPWYEMEAKAWDDGYFPMWDPYVWSGQPLVGQMQPGAVFPLNWPLFAAALGEDGHIRYRLIHLQRLGIYLLGALFAFGLARELGRSRFASLFAGLAFGCVGALPGFDWPQIANGAIWLPLTLVLFHRAARAPTQPEMTAWTILCGGSIGMSLLSGHHQTPFFSLLALGCVLMFLVWEERESGLTKLTKYGVFLAMAGAVAFAVSALQLLPAFEYADLVYRWVGAPQPISGEDVIPYYVHEGLALSPAFLLGVVTPRLYSAANIYVGWTVALLAFYGIVSGWRERWVRGYALLAAAAFAYSLGGWSLLHGWLYQFLPTAAAVRSSDRAVFVAQLALFVLAAYGIDHLRTASQQGAADCSWLRKAQWTLVGFAGVVYAVLITMSIQAELSGGRPHFFAGSAIAALLLAAGLEAYKRGAIGWSAFGVALVALMLSESYATQPFDITELEAPSLRQSINRLENEYSGSMAFLQGRARQEDRFRFTLEPELRDINIGARYGLEQTDGYLVAVSRDVFDILGVLGWDRGFDVLNTRYTVARTQQRANQIEVFADVNGVKVFLNPLAGPRAWLTDSGEFVTNDDASLADPVAGKGCEIPNDAVKMTGWTIQGSTWTTVAPCPGFFVLADPYYPGWEATVNGAPATILRYHNGLRAVRVAAGESALVFRFWPPTVIGGAWLTGIGLLLCCGAGVWLGFWKHHS